jgi:hypothetical protein
VRGERSAGQAGDCCRAASRSTEEAEGETWVNRGSRGQKVIHTLPGFELLGFVRKPNLVLLWLVDAKRDFAGFELARPLSNGKLVWKVPVPQPSVPVVTVIAKTEAQPTQSLEEALLLVTSEVSAEEGSTFPDMAQTLWSTLLVSGQHANEVD